MLATAGFATDQTKVFKKVAAKALCRNGIGSGYA
jgi:hypothetical protein